MVHEHKMSFAKVPKPLLRHPNLSVTVQ